MYVIDLLEHVLSQGTPLSLLLLSHESHKFFENTKVVEQLLPE
jgi:hypothetical protein